MEIESNRSVRAEAAPPGREDMNSYTSSMFHWPGSEGRKQKGCVADGGDGGLLYPGRSEHWLDCPWAGWSDWPVEGEAAAAGFCTEGEHICQTLRELCLWQEESCTSHSEDFNELHKTTSFISNTMSKCCLTFFLGSRLQWFSSPLSALCFFMFSRVAFRFGKRPTLFVHPTL